MEANVLGIEERSSYSEETSLEEEETEEELEEVDIETLLSDMAA